MVPATGSGFSSRFGCTACTPAQLPGYFFIFASKGDRAMNPTTLRLAIILCAIAALVVCIVLAVVLWRRRKRRKLLADQLSCKLREEALDRALANPHAPASCSVPDPVEIQYNLKADRTGAGLLLRLTEHNLTVTRTYLLDRGQRLFLGIADGQTVVRRDYAPRCGILCELYQSKDAQLARGLLSGVQLQRGHTTVPLGHDGIVLRTGDELLLPGTQFRVDLIGSRG